jgi:hypothetical protein
MDGAGAVERNHCCGTLPCDLSLREGGRSICADARGFEQLSSCDEFFC